MKLLLLTPFYYPNVAGSSRLLGDIVDQLIHSGHTVEVLTYAGDPDECKAFDTRQLYVIHRVKPIGIPGSSSVMMLKTLFTLCRSNKYDCILCGVAYSISLLAYFNSMINGIKYAVYSHGEDAVCVLDKPYQRNLLQQALNGAFAVIGNSRFTLDTLRKLGIPDDRLHLCSPGIDPEPYLQVKPEAVARLRERLNLPDKRVVLTLARLNPRKGHDTVIKALPNVLQRVPDLHYLIVGKGDPGDLRQLADSLNVGDRVTIVSYVEDSDLPTLFNLADLYVMVSRWDEVAREVEGFGIVYLEAAASGKPSIGANVGGARDAIDDGVTGILVDPLSIDQLADAMILLLTDTQKAIDMGNAGRERVLHEYRKDMLLRKIEDVLVNGLLN